MSTDLVAILFVFLLLVVVPLLSFLTARRVDLRRISRLDLYFSAVLSQWVLTALGLAAVFLSGSDFSALGFRSATAAAFAQWMLLLTAISLAALGLELILERIGWWPEESELVLLLLPETRREKLWAVLVLAPTAALCEEFLYRGYLLAQLSAWFERGPWAWLVSSVAFGLAHAYQGMTGIVRAGLLGALLAYPVIRLGSLYPSMASHLLIDALAFAWLGPAFVRRSPVTPDKVEKPCLRGSGGGGNALD